MSVIHVVDVSGALPIDLMDRPHAFGVPFACVRFVDLVAQYIFIAERTGANSLKPRGEFFALGSQLLVEILLLFVFAAPVMEYHSSLSF